MRFKTTLPLLLLPMLAAACSGPEPRYRMDSAPPAASMRLAVGTLEVREVSLPAYADASEILLEDASGAMTQVEDALWADDPRRAMTQTLAERLGVISGATVAAEPWPLEEPAQAAVHVRVSEAVASASGSFRLKGQYALSSYDRVIRERVSRFEITVPLQAASAGAIADAAGRATAQLADRIASDLAR
ncbi:membrane integrity-associated transporter subunit PqiC [Alloyangia pacifica]|uniref:PqiC family protein n=1 Tax=Alloyangia pacifica TaxID=311180 RepID=UPI001CFDBCCF|nr:ABC-type transport auxiliary lipoprotein family protein [Alloyangia pacifica]